METSRSTVGSSYQDKYKVSGQGIPGEISPPLLPRSEASSPEPEETKHSPELASSSLPIEDREVELPSQWQGLASLLISWGICSEKQLLEGVFRATQNLISFVLANLPLPAFDGDQEDSQKELAFDEAMKSAQDSVVASLSHVDNSKKENLVKSLKETLFPEFETAIQVVLFQQGSQGKKDQKATLQKAEFLHQKLQLFASQIAVRLENPSSHRSGSRANRSFRLEGKLTSQGKGSGAGITYESIFSEKDSQGRVSSFSCLWTREPVYEKGKWPPIEATLLDISPTHPQWANRSMAVYKVAKDLLKINVIPRTWLIEIHGKPGVAKENLQGRKINQGEPPWAPFEVNEDWKETLQANIASWRGHAPSKLLEKWVIFEGALYGELLRFHDGQIEQALPGQLRSPEEQKKDGEEIDFHLPFSIEEQDGLQEIAQLKLLYLLCGNIAPLEVLAFRGGRSTTCFDREEASSVPTGLRGLHYSFCFGKWPEKVTPLLPPLSPEPEQIEVDSQQGRTPHLLYHQWKKLEDQAQAIAREIEKCGFIISGNQRHHTFIKEYQQLLEQKQKKEKEWKELFCEILGKPFLNRVQKLCPQDLEDTLAPYLKEEEIGAACERLKDLQARLFFEDENKEEANPKENFRIEEVARLTQWLVAPTL